MYLSYGIEPSEIQYAMLLICIFMHIRKFHVQFIRSHAYHSHTQYNMLYRKIIIKRPKCRYPSLEASYEAVRPNHLAEKPVGEKPAERGS